MRCANVTHRLGCSAALLVKGGETAGSGGERGEAAAQTSTQSELAAQTADKAQITALEHLSRVALIEILPDAPLSFS